jgi:hypothetical protein
LSGVSNSIENFCYLFFYNFGVCPFHYVY